MATRMQQRRGTSEQWTTVNPVLAEGEIGLETDTNKFKIGNGVTAWSALDYASLSTSDLADYATATYVDNAIAAIPSTDLTGYATETYVDTSIANLVDTAPATLDTLNELAAALGDDPNFATTVTNSISSKADAVHTHTVADVTDVTATASELNVLDGITATTTELNYTDGVTSNIQTQLNGKAASSHTHTSSQITDLTTNVVSRTNGTVSTASTSSNVVRNITLSTAAPSGGADGDVWLKYTA